jgi:hypothetical protein
VVNRLSIRTIAETVADLGGISWSELTANRRERRLCRVRHVAMWQARRRTSASLSTIARVFARDHTSVVHACAMVDQRAAGDPFVATSDQALDAIEMALAAAGLPSEAPPDGLELARRAATGPHRAISLSVDEIQALAEYALELRQERRILQVLVDAAAILSAAEEALVAAEETSREANARRVRDAASARLAAVFNVVSKEV